MAKKLQTYSRYEIVNAAAIVGCGYKVACGRFLGALYCNKEPKKFGETFDSFVSLLLLRPSLSEREAVVLRLRYGFWGDGNRQMTKTSIATYLGVSVDTVRNIENKALRKLRHPSRLGPIEQIMDCR